LKLLRERIHHTGRRLYQEDKIIAELSDQLTKTFNPSDWVNFQMIYQDRHSKTLNLQKTHLTNKFNKLVGNSKSKPTAANPIKNAINFSSAKIDSNTFSVFEKGLNYAITPSKIPVDDFICGYQSEPSISRLR
jgi:hypothetical protein